MEEKTSIDREQRQRELEKGGEREGEREREINKERGKREIERESEREGGGRGGEGGKEGGERIKRRKGILWELFQMRKNNIISDLKQKLDTAK